MGGEFMFTRPCISIRFVILHTKQVGYIKMTLTPVARVAHDGDQEVQHQEDDEEGEEQEHRDRRLLRVVVDIVAAEHGQDDLSWGVNARHS